MNTPFIAANWKMYKTAVDAQAFGSALLKENLPADREVCVAASPTLLPTVAGVFAGANVFVAAQNMYFEDDGAFTGETSPLQVKDTGATHVILGHSERRHIFGETDEMLNSKVLAAQKHGLTPIFCVGETLDQRKAGKAQEVVQQQIELGLAKIDQKFLEKTIVAYEPVWAIGTGETATPEQAEEMHLFLKELLPPDTRVLYGGSVKPENCDQLAAQPSIDGFLVGGASLEVESFLRIINATF